MTDEPTPTNGPADDWVMPEPVFRSSEGRKPGELPPDPQSEIPTEPGFSDDDGDDENEPSANQTVRARTGDRKTRHIKKKRGCAKTFAMIVGTIAFVAVTLVAALIYFLFYYRPVDTTTF